MAPSAPPAASAPRRAPALRVLLMGAGWLLIVVSPLFGLLPGPGGIFVFAGGLSLVLRTSPWAQRAYVRFKRRWPRCGGWCDWGMRRASHRRRAARMPAEAAAAD